MKRLFQILAAACFFAGAVFAEDVYFREPFTLWQDPEILVWTPDSAAPIDPREFSLSLKRNNSGEARPYASPENWNAIQAPSFTPSGLRTICFREFRQNF